MWPTRSSMTWLLLISLTWPFTFSPTHLGYHVELLFVPVTQQTHALCIILFYSNFLPMYDFLFFKSELKHHRLRKAFLSFFRWRAPPPSLPPLSDSPVCNSGLCLLSLFFSAPQLECKLHDPCLAHPTLRPQHYRTAWHSGRQMLFEVVSEWAEWIEWMMPSQFFFHWSEIHKT